jgi:hypothetical protein
MKRRFQWTAALGLLGIVLAGCGGDKIIGEEVTNQPPSTSVTSTPPVLDQASFSVTFYWDGEDPDSEIRGFAWRISDNGEDGVIDVADTLTADLPWHFTTASDSTFVVSAVNDSFHVDVNDPKQGAEDYRYWQTHTFFVRAVDAEGMTDPTPAMVSFTATTIAPTVKINVPQLPSFNSCVSAARVLTFGWEGNDQDTIGNEPAASRYLLRRVGGPGDNCLTETDYRNLAPIHGDDPDWSDWIPYDAPNDSGRIVTLPKQSVSDKFLFAVQVKDVAGAVTPTFVWGDNVKHVEIGTDKYPSLLVNEKFLGGETFAGVNRVKAFDIVEGVPLEFTWSADASSYAGVIDAFRYGWDVADPNDENDPGWAVSWGKGAAWRRAKPRSFLQGAHNFVVRVRDNSGTISQGLYLLQVVQIAKPPEQRPILLVDDWRNADTAEGQAFDALWDRRWNDILQPVVGFQPADVIEAQDAGGLLKFATVNEYRGVVWFVNASKKSFFFNAFAPVSLDTPQFNWMQVYQARVGNLFLVGPSAVLNGIEPSNPPWQFPIVFDVPNRYPLGFGQQEDVSGQKFNRGTTRYPYAAWCLETVDIVRPGVPFIYDERAGTRERTKACSDIYRARLDDDFYTNFLGASAAGVTDLLPRLERKQEDPTYYFNVEEFYNKNISTRKLSLQLRTCQKTMYRAEARADAKDPEPDPDAGTPGIQVVPDLQLVCGKSDGANFDRATAGPDDHAAGITGAPIGIVSTVYQATKQIPGSEDFLWGFNPMGFEQSQIKAAILWLIRDRWDIRVEG